LVWNRGCGKSLAIKNGDKSAFLNDNNYIFRSVLATFGFTSGIHYWEIILDGRTQNEIKIGVSSSTRFNFDTSFSDYDFGWAFYCNSLFY
jgi:hypothetical protein